MGNPYTIDASVFINAFNPHEPGHEASQDFLALVHKRALPIIIPTLLLPELAATIGRGRRDAQLARRFAAQVTRFPHLLLVELDTLLTHQAVAIAADHKLRGSDAVYAAVALCFGCTLVSLDQEQCTQVAAVLATCARDEAPAELKRNPA